MKTTAAIILTLVASTAGVLGCDGTTGTNQPAKTPEGTIIKDSAGQTLSQKAADKFGDGAKLLAAHDKASDWSDATCSESAKTFMDAAEAQGSKTFNEALYNAGVAYQRCKNDTEARKLFEKILDGNPKFHRARVQVALYDFIGSGRKDIEKAISEMQRAIADAEFKNEEALVHLAMLQMTRDNDVSDDDGKNDFDRAKVNLQRALAINDSYMPAFNQLAVYYLESAKKKAGQKTRGGRVTAASERKNKADPQMLELAQLVCSQALRKNPSYAPVYNTTGLIMAELGDLSQAARSFASARKLDPKFFEAHMNYAAVNLQFRGFEQAEEAYKQALKLQPNEFEAHLGRALALRGLINDSNFDQMLAESAKEIAEARRLDADRPETYYNEAILTQEFKARQGESEPMLLKAKGLFDDFIKKASGKDEYKDAAARATERIKDIDQMVEFNRQTKEEQKRMEEERKRMEAEQAIKDQAAGATPGGGEPK